MLCRRWRSKFFTRRLCSKVLFEYHKIDHEMYFSAADAFPTVEHASVPKDAITNAIHVSWKYMDVNNSLQPCDMHWVKSYIQMYAVEYSIV